MKRFFFAATIFLFMVLFSLLVSCDKKAGEKLHITRAVYSDNNVSGFVDAGDLVYVVFDRNITTSFGSYTPDDIFELSGSTDSFGISGATIERHCTYAVRITLGAGASLSLDSSGFVISDVKVHTYLPVGVIKETATNTPIFAGGTYKNVAGRAGFAAPTIVSAIYYDSNENLGIDQNDLLVLQFSDAITTPEGIWGAFGVFELPVNFDTLGSLVVATKTTSNTVTITNRCGSEVES
ncbi:MAG: hypothetical protein ABIH42_01545 [Planctomycetota bacterium]